jgi:4-amino-4-deoxy-L-arabinose transferase-like glycosyltransferase
MKKIKEHRAILYQLMIVLVAALLFVPFLGRIHLFDWDEVNFAESAREMIVSNDYLNVQINFKPFWEKPPLFIWMQVISMKIFGINEFAARFPNALCGIVTLLVLFNTGRRIYDEKFGLIWVMAWLGSFLPFLYFKSGIIDPWFNLFIFSGICFFIYYTKNGERKNYRQLLLSALFVGLAILTKGPVAFLIFFLTVAVFWIYNGFKLPVRLTDIFVFVFVMALVGGSWFIMQIISGHLDVVASFIRYQLRLFQTKDAGHGGFFLYHFVILLAGVFPASVFAIRGFVKHPADTFYQRTFRRWMIVLFWVVLILFSIVKTKIVHYSSLCYFPVTYLAAFVIYKVIKGEIKYNRWLTVLVIIIGIIYSLAVILLPLADRYIQQIIDFAGRHDRFAAGCLRADVSWPGAVSVIGIILLLGVLIFVFSGRQKHFTRGVIALFAASTVFVFLCILTIAPRVERYVQNSLIEFYKDRRGEDAYFETLGYKSYAHYFYTHRKKPANDMVYDKQRLLHGDIDRKVYFSIKIDKKDRILKDNPSLLFLYEKDGFAFCERNPKKTGNHDKQ